MNRIKIFLLCLGLISCTYSFSQEETLEVLLEKAESGNADYQYKLGKYYLNINESSIGFPWFQRAALQNHKVGMYFTGWCYYYGEGVKKDLRKAYYWFTKCAQKGDSQAKKMVKSIKNQINVDDIIFADPFDPSRPPILEIIPNSILFTDANKNNAIDANENCCIKFKIHNNGKGNAINCFAKIIPNETTKEIKYADINIPLIKPQETIDVSMPLTSTTKVSDGIANLRLKVEEPHGFGTETASISINTKKFVAPLLQIVDSKVSPSEGTTLKKMSPFYLQVLLQNTKKGSADNVKVKIGLPTNVLLMESQKEEEYFAYISGGETKSINYPLIINNNYASNDVPITLYVKEKYGEYAENKTINLHINQSITNNNIIIKEKEINAKNQDIKIASISSDIDKNIPEAINSNSNTFAIVIANETYNKEANVPYAVNDGNIFKEYCRNCLGIPEKNIHLITNATLNDIRHEVKWIQDVAEVYKGEAKIIFYYAGHGIPDEKSKNAYLLPTDGYGSDVATGYSLENLYKTFGSLPSKSITVFLDACFSGAKRDGNMLASARGVAIKVKQTIPVGNMVVFTAAQGDETAYPYKEEEHGLFTYYLLKKLQETKGNATLGELSDYIKEQVERQSIVTNGKLQSPSIMATSSIGNEWKNWTLNK